MANSDDQARRFENGYLNKPAAEPEPIDTEDRRRAFDVESRNHFSAEDRGIKRESVSFNASADFGLIQGHEMESGLCDVEGGISSASYATPVPQSVVDRMAEDARAAGFEPVTPAEADRVKNTVREFLRGIPPKIISDLPPDWEAIRRIDDPEK